MTPEIFNTDEACEYLKIARVTLYKYVREGTLPAFKMGKIWKFHKSSIDKWVEGRVKEDTQARSYVSENKKKSPSRRKKL